MGKNDTVPLKWRKMGQEKNHYKSVDSLLLGVIYVSEFSMVSIGMLLALIPSSIKKKFSSQKTI